MRTLTLLCLAACSDYELNAGPRGDPPKSPFEPETHQQQAVEDRFVAQGAAGADILFYGDTSGSMTEELVTLGDRLDAFLTRLGEVTGSWQLLAVTGPDGCGQGGVLTAATPDYRSTFSAGLLTPPGAEDVDEWGLNNVATALESTDAGECNEGFLRSEAELHVIFVSDEDDNSPGWDSGDAEYWRAYTDRIAAAKGDTGSVWISSITGAVPAGCAGAEPGTGYVEATTAYEGTWLDICSDWSGELARLAEVQSRQSIFVLSHRPDADTLEVYVDEELREDGWSYEVGPNELIFTADAPVTGQSVRVTYTVAAS